MDFDGPHSLGQLRDEQGVYIVLDRFENEYRRTMLYCIDVGESDTVHSGVSGHDRMACWGANTQGALVFAVLYTGGDSDARRQTERALRDFLSPPCGSS